VFERFTDRARRVVVLAQEEARMLNHNYIGTEHILLGLIHEEQGLAARALESLGISLEAVRSHIQEMVGKSEAAPVGHIPFTPRAKKVMELSLREAIELGHNYIGTEHLLLGLIREGEGVAAQALAKLGADMKQVRGIVITLISEHVHPEGGETFETVPTRDPKAMPMCPRCGASLAETAAFRVLDLPPADEGESRAVTFAFCRRCGTWLGTVA
jgi:ATP-dependent Clp protease ATP-binding subunit ClpC